MVLHPPDLDYEDYKQFHKSVIEYASKRNITPPNNMTWIQYIISRIYLKYNGRKVFCMGINKKVDVAEAVEALNEAHQYIQSQRREISALQAQLRSKQ